MKLTRAIFLGLAFLIPTVSTVARAEDKPAAEAPADAKDAKDAKKAKKSKKAKKEGEAAKDEAAPAADKK